MESETYTASPDSFTKTITGLIIILFTGIGVQCLIELTKAAGNWHLVVVPESVIFLLAAMLSGVYLFSPQGYELQGGELIIKRPARDKRIKLPDLTTAKILTDPDMAWTIRTLGVGGLFGYYGKYYNSTLGNLTQYATRRNNRILLQTQQGEKIIITPDNLDLAYKLQLAVMPPT